jgi:hypothetical protein
MRAHYIARCDKCFDFLQGLSLNELRLNFAQFSSQLLALFPQPAPFLDALLFCGPTLLFPLHDRVDYNTADEKAGRTSSSSLDSEGDGIFESSGAGNLA